MRSAAHLAEPTRGTTLSLLAVFKDRQGWGLVYDQRAVSFTSSDAGQLGKETSNGWTTYDAWDVFVARVHGGSERAALENYCEVSGYNQVKLHTIVKKWGQS